MNTNRRQLIKTLFFAPVAALAARFALARPQVEARPVKLPEPIQPAKYRYEVRCMNGLQVAVITNMRNGHQWSGPIPEPTENNQ